jgi:Flp pilus assembly protein TadD
MKIRKLPAISLLLVLTTLPAPGANPDKAQLEAMYDKAFQAFDAANYDQALKALDAIDARQPDLAESLNLRGVVYMRQGRYDKAETVLRKALTIEPRFWNASFNLAEIPFLRKDWKEARTRFEGLIAGDNEGLQPETVQLIQYKVLLTFVLQGKENMVDWIMNKFEVAKDSPALYYSNAAIAFQHGNQKEAAEWLSAADKHFPAPLNKLYAESFYEVGWKEKPAGESRPAIEITSTAERAEHLKADAKANFEKAERAFQQRDYKGAMQLVDLAAAAMPNDAATDNLRGEILMEEGKLDEAEAAFGKSFADDSNFREAQYNLAQIALKKKDYQKARDRFEALFAETPGDEKNQAAQLIKYKIFVTLLLEGKDAEAQRLMDQFKYTGDTPALYYSHAAWEFKHGHAEQGEDWVRSARKIYSPALNVVFADSFYDLGWLQKMGEQGPPTTAPLAQAEASPLSGATPAMRFGQAEPVPAPVAAEGIASPAPGVPSAAAATSGPSAAAAPSNSVVPEAAVPAQIRTEKVAATPQAVATPAPTHLEPSQARAWAPTFAEMIDRISRPSTLLVGGLLLAGILLLVGLVIQQARRNLGAMPLYPSSTPLTEPPFHGEESGIRERKLSREMISGAPPKLSLNLKGNEPAVRAAVAPAAVVTARAVTPEASEPVTPVELPAEQAAKPIQEVEPPPVDVPPPIIPIVPPVPESIPAVAQAAALPAEEELPAEAMNAPWRNGEKVLLPAARRGVEAVAPEPTPAREVPPPPARPEMPAPEVTPEPAFAAAPKEEEVAPELLEAINAPVEEPLPGSEEPIGQGEPIPHLTTALSAEAIISELAQPEPESPLELLEPEGEIAVPIAGHRPVESSIETPSFASKIISSEPIRLQPTIPVTMPETTITPAATPAYRTPSPTMSVQQPAGAMHTAVQLTFSLEIASMQLTPTFKMSGLQLKPTSKVVSMRLAPSQDPQPPMNLQVTFEVARIDLSGGAIGSVRLAPSAQQKPAVLNSPSFAISGLELVAGSGAAPVQLTPSHQEQASVHLTAEFQIAAIEFTPLFEIAAIVLNSTSRKVSMQLPGSGPTSIDSAPVFEIENVQLGPGNELGLVQVTPGRGARA